MGSLGEPVLDPPCIQARAATADVTAVTGDRLDHPVQMVVAVWDLLARCRAPDRVAHEEDAHLGVVALRQRFRQPKPYDRSVP